GQLSQANQTIDELKSKLMECETKRGSFQTQVTAKSSELESERMKNRTLQEQIELLKSTNTNLLERLADLSVVSREGAESIRKSLETLDKQTKMVNDLNQGIQRRDSVNLALVMNLKRSLADVNDQDIQVEVKKGVVYISISDKLLFKSGSAIINKSAESVVEKIATVLNDHSELDILVEGHTDNVPIATDCIKDNWDLSAHRSTAVVRMLQKKYNVSPERMTAGGRGEYIPKASNDTNEGRAQNRRTEIIVLPDLEQFFKLSAGQ
ncbi:MAG: OmpA family protein, partial [Saprospiraceae bacterium]|nr:OmpA family protein [Saprospiraceae bacterium]